LSSGFASKTRSISRKGANGAKKLNIPYPGAEFGVNPKHDTELEAVCYGDMASEVPTSPIAQHLPKIL
jgi:hypothetical protein